MADAENQAVAFDDGVDHPVISDPQFSKPCKFTFENRMGVRSLRKFVFDLIKDFPCKLPDLIPVAVLLHFRSILPSGHSGSHSEKVLTFSECRVRWSS